MPTIPPDEERPPYIPAMAERPPEKKRPSDVVPLRSSDPNRFHCDVRLANKIGFLLLSCLEGKERRFMEMRMGFGLAKGMTLAQAGDMIGMNELEAFEFETGILEWVFLCCRTIATRKTRIRDLTPIEDLNISSRSINTLKQRGIRYVEIACMMSDSYLSRIPRFGIRGAKELKEEIEKRGFTLMQGMLDM